ncbi:MAG: alpha/beta hydrolase [Anaerolineae bacterium]|nr:alpha/beta hydrolase [Anaerolineae bacterium]
MPLLVTPQGVVHYETYGRGRPVLLLHGWLGSWRLWRKTIEELGKEFRTYALDFWGFGEMGDQGADFSVDNFVTLVNQFMDRLGIVKAPLIGHSMGGTVSLSASVRSPEKVVKIIVIGSPIVGTSLSPLLKMAGYRGWIGLAETAPFLFDTFMSGLKVSLRGYSYLLSKDGKTLSQMFQDDLSKLTVGPFFESIATLRQTDLRPLMSSVKLPVMGIYGARDLIVNPNQHKLLQQYVPHSKVELFQNSGHFPMLDEPERFHRTVRDFLNNG